VLKIHAEVREDAKIGLGYLQRPFAAFATSREAVR